MLNAQYSPITFETISTQHGLSDNTVNCVAQDSKGFIWFATDNGLNRYDGYSILAYTHLPDDPNSISGNLIKSICVDRYGILWIGSLDGGLQKYDPIKETFTSYNFGKPGDVPNSNDIFTIFEDSKGRLWVGTYGGGLNLVERNHRGVIFKYFTNNPKDSTSISSNNIRCITELSNGEIWIGTEESGINIIHPTTEDTDKITFEHIDITTSNNSPFDGAVMSITEGDSSNIWIGTWGEGLIKFNKQKSQLQSSTLLYPNDFSKIITSVLRFENSLWVGTWGNGLYQINSDFSITGKWNKSVWHNENISENKIWSIYRDRNNTMWIGTNEGGVNRFNVYSKKFSAISRFSAERMSLPDNEVQCFAEMANGNIIIGTRRGGLNIYDINKNEISKYPIIDKSISILSLHIDKKNNLWIGTDGDGLIGYNLRTKQQKKYNHSISDTLSISNNAIFDIYEDSLGNLWLGTWGGGFSYFDTDKHEFHNYKINTKNLSQNVVLDIEADSKGTLWMASFGEGLINFNPITDKIVFYKHEELDKNSISTNILRQVYVDINDNVWIGTNSNGLEKYDITLRKFVHFTEKSGLYNNKIEGILSDSSGNIWISSNTGLSMLANNEIDIYNYGIDDGLQANEFSIGALFYSTSGYIYAGGINGMNIFKPGTITVDTVPPSIVVTDLKINNKTISVGEMVNGTVVLRESITQTKSIDLSYKDKVISFEFSALDFTPNHKNKFAYKLDGFDENWNYATSNVRFAHYTNLDPGQYVFTVKGSNSDDVWNDEGVSIGINIAPPFWQTWWFYILTSISVVAAIYSFIKYRNLKLSKQKEALETEVGFRTKTIESQKSVLEHRLEELKIKSKELEEKNEEIQLQNEVVLSYVKEIESKREEVLQQKQEIIESIMYARRIQKALFPTKQYLDFVLDDYFIYFKPRDIVSGDYYWIAEKEGKTIIVVADCTGHGVPGAFMSLLGISFLNEIVNKEISFKANEILNQVRSSVITSLNQTGQDDEAKDGMDMSLCIIDKDERIIQYAGANNPMYLFNKDGEFSMIKADKMPIGIFLGEEVSFSCQIFEYEPGDTIYMFSDGYVDQFGGEKGKKFKSTRFKSLLASIQDKNMRQQKMMLNKTINDWMAYPHPDGYNNFQVDDMLVLGIRLK